MIKKLQTGKKIIQVSYFYKYKYFNSTLIIIYKDENVDNTNEKPVDAEDNLKILATESKEISNSTENLLTKSTEEMIKSTVKDIETSQKTEDSKFFF